MRAGLREGVEQGRGHVGTLVFTCSSVEEFVYCLQLDLCEL